MAAAIKLWDLLTARDRLFTLRAEGLSFRAAARAIRGEGFGYRTEHMLSDWRRMGTFVRAASALGKLAYEEVLHYKDMVPAWRSLTQKYKYDVYYKVVDPETGDSYQGNWSMMSDIELTRGQVEGTAMASLEVATEVWGETPDLYGKEIVEIQAVRGWRQGRW